MMEKQPTQRRCEGSKENERNEAEIEEIVVVLRKAEQSEGQHTFRPVLLMVVENT